jgi:hypothetical protein
MRALRRGIVAAVLTVTFVMGVASAASAQGQPYDLASTGSTAAAIGIPGAAVGWRYRDAADVVVVPDAASLDAQALDNIARVVWVNEPVKFRFLEVRSGDQVLARQSYTELRQTFGKRPAGLEQQSLQSLADSLDRMFDTGIDLVRIMVIAVTVVVGLAALAIVLFVLAQWRRTQAEAKLQDAGDLPGLSR